MVAECHRVRHEVNPATVVYREEALHNCRPEIEPVATSETDPLEVPDARTAAQARVQVTFHPNAPVGVMLAISLGSPAESGRALRLAGHSQIKEVNCPQIVLLKVKGPQRHNNAQTGTRVR